MYSTLLILLVIVALVALVLSRREGFDTQSEYALNRQWRLLWDQHVAWTRMTIIAIASRSRDETATTARLLKNASDMADVIARHFGSDPARRFSRLFTDHLTIADRLVASARDGDVGTFSTLESAWSKNADDISAFLSQLNPHWKYETVRDAMRSHLRLTLAEATARLNGQYDADIAAYDAVEKEAMMMADMFSEGIAAQS